MKKEYKFKADTLILSGLVALIFMVVVGFVAYQCGYSNQKEETPVLPSIGTVLEDGVREGAIPLSQYVWYEHEYSKFALRWFVGISLFLVGTGILIHGIYLVRVNDPPEKWD